ncbi:MAG TPA: N-acyl homoserine lactonase family protein [Candidatus Bathyarchaeia archaeon]|nr:N-acyl homoserine lactonase family protein [Candidatus Bathyarchaeia archaeon]
MAHPRVQPIHTGHYTMPADGDRFPGERVVVTAFVIEHARGVFLFDTGFSPEPRKMVDLYQPVYMRPIDEALRAAGHGITDVKLIANCHFHADHAGGNRHFTRTPIFVQKRELAHARQQSDYTHLPHVADFPGAALEEIDGDAEPWPGIHIVPTPGHSPGHQSVVVDTKEGRVVLAGQALSFSSDYARHQYSHELALAGEQHAAYPDWIARFHEFDPVRVHFAHDRAIWQRDVAESIR